MKLVVTKMMTKMKTMMLNFQLIFTKGMGSFQDMWSNVGTNEVPIGSIVD